MNLSVFGASTEHLKSYGEFQMHVDVVDDYERLTAAVMSEGMSLDLVSAFRSFDRQKEIWQAKALGERAVYDDQSQSIDISELNDIEKLLATFRWSALPGLSRHHWGTDLDVYDSSAVDADYEVQLLPAEYRGDGPFVRLAAWLQDNAGEFGFYFPYDIDRGGVAPEAWHMSHKKTSGLMIEQVTSQSYRKFLEQHPFELSTAAFENVDTILDRFVFSVPR